ncbi:hypothetical protein ACS0TY_015922 [Phlomoides rotata]
MSLDFAPILKHVPFMKYLWRHFADMVLNENLRLVVGQQEHMLNGANVMCQNCTLAENISKIGI